MGKSERAKQWQREYSKKKRLKSVDVWLSCRNCGEPTLGKSYRLVHYKRDGKLCDTCNRQSSSNNLNKLRATQTPEEKSEFAKLARSCSSAENRSNAVKKQWEGFRADPIKYQEICLAKVERSKRVWANYNQETKTRIVTALYGSHGKARSLSSDKFKQFLIDNNLYDGFESEVSIDKYIVDECNPQKKLIIEFFGDAYHCNPRKYKDPNHLQKCIQRTVQEQWDRDSKRLQDLEKLGYKILVVWEYDFNRRKKYILQRVKDFLNENQENHQT